MKKILLITFLFLFGFSQAQTIKFSEDFETLPLSVVSSGSSNWARSNILYYSGAYSDSASITAVGDTTILTTNAFSTSGYSKVLLKFNHIAKLALFDGAYIEVSADNGVNWTRLGHAQYYGNGYFGQVGNPIFNGISYSDDWKVINDAAVPSNSWWKGETFDLSYIAAGASQVKVRFVLYGNTTTTYGWLIDDIKIITSNTDLVPPMISIAVPMPKDTVLSTGPFTISATITDSSGVSSASIVYSVAGVFDTIAMTASGSLYTGILPSQAYGTTVCYHIIAYDINSNMGANPASSCISYTTKKDPSAPAAFPYDVAMSSIENPQAVMQANFNSNVDIRIVNRGDSSITKATIGWELDGTTQTPYVWTGNLSLDMVSNIFTIGSPNYTPGPHDIKVFAYAPNDSTDQNSSNDTLEMSFYACNSIYSGNYTLGGSGADFVDFDDLMVALNHCGLSGPTTINVNPGIYNSQLLFSNDINGLDSLNHLTIVSTTNNKNDVIITYAPTSSSTNYVVGFDTVGWVSFKDVTIKGTGGNNSGAIFINNNSSYISFEGCSIISDYGNNASTNTININGENIHDIEFISNDVYGGYYGLRVQGIYNLKMNNISFVGNTIKQFYRYAAYLNYVTGLTFNSNVISRTYDDNNTTLNGLYFNNIDFFNIESNTIDLVPDAASTAIYLSSVGGILGSEGIVANNMISISGNSTSSSIYGLKLYNSHNIGIYYNSIALYAGSSSNSSAFYISGTTSTDIKANNNIFAHFNQGMPFYHYAGSFTSLDYNAYYTNGLILMKWGGYNGQTASTSGGITAIQGLSNHDTNSVVTDPMFYSESNLHSFGANINGVGLAITAVPTDIDGEVRSLTAPDIGADEFSISSIDAGVLSVLYPLAVDTQSNVVPFKVIIKNYGSAAFTSMSIKYTIDGGAIQSYSWSGNLASGMADTVTLGQITLPYGEYSLQAYTQLTGDTIPLNDSVYVVRNTLPLIDAQVSSLVGPADGCGKGSMEDVSLEITNNGVTYIYNGLTASYNINGGPFVTETVSDTIAPGASITFTFNQQADLTSGFQDSTFHFIGAVHHSDDPYSLNDTSAFDVVSYGNLFPPIVSDTTVNYGDTVTLVAFSNDPVLWYENDSTSVVLGNGSYTTPNLYDTTTYYAQANAYNPPVTAVVGFSTNMFGPFDMSPYGANMASGKYQILYTAAELNAAGLVAGNLESIAFNVASAFNGPSVGFEVSLANVSNSVMTSSFLSPTFTLVNSGTFVGVAGWNTHTFINPYYWDGTSNLLIQICTSGNPYNAAPMYYTNTAATMLTGSQGMGVSCSMVSGFAKLKRPNIRFVKQGSAGCYSAKVPLTVNVPLPTIDARVNAIVDPKSACGLASTQVTIAIENMGTDTIPAGYTASYRVDNGAYSTPETIALTIAPGDTVQYTFSALTSLAPGASGTNYVITAKVFVTSDTYSPNDSLISDSIFSKYTPVNPIVNDMTINYADSATLIATATDSVYWYADSIGTQLVGMGSSFVTIPIYDTTTFFAQTRKTIIATDYTIGTGTNITSYSDPSPYGAGGYTGFGAKSQFLITAAEMKALGMIQGPINSLSFYVNIVKGIPLKNYTIRIASTNVSDLSGTYFIQSGLTTVFTSNSYTEHNAWNEHDFSSPFYWDGNSNIVIETCFKNNSGVSYANVRYTTTPYISVGHTKGGAIFNCADSVMNLSSYNRPNIRFNQEGLGLCKSDLMPMDVNIINYQNDDAALTAFVEPMGSASSVSPSDVKVVLKNYGINTITSATINWSENGNAQQAYSWSGSLAQGASDTLTIASAHSFMGGSTELKSWVTVANDVTYTNDTAFANIVVCMSGAYSINSVTGDYKSFTEAITDLNTVGVCGPVVFNADSGIYPEQVVLFSVQGSSPTNTITFQSTALDSSKVTLMYSTLVNNNYVLKLEGASNIIIKNLNIVANGSNYGNCIVLGSGASNIEIANNKLVSTNPSSSSAIASSVYSKLSGIDNINIANNYIKYGNYAVYLEGNAADSLSNINFANNSFEGFVRYGVYCRYANDLTITNNDFVSSVQSSSAYGIYIYRNKWLSIEKNKLVLSGSGYTYGINLSYTEGTSSQRSLVANNFISIVSGSGTKYGINLSNVQYTDIVYNSINIISGSISSRALYLSGGSNLNIKNNIIATIAGYAIYSTGIPSNSLVDYNNIYVDTTLSNKYVRWSSDIADLAALKLFDTGNNQNSVSVTPDYVSTTDLHSQQISLYNAATPIASITTDIDGDIRNTTAPSIGADEFTPPAIDLGIITMPYPDKSDCGYSSSDSIVILIKNQGLNNLNFTSLNATIKVYISGIVTDTITYVINSGTLNSGNEMMVKVSNNYDLSINGLYSFEADVIIVGDGNSLNNHMDKIDVVSLPNINTFPFNEDFESGYNISFVETMDSESELSITSAAANNSSFGMHFQGGGYSSWYNKTDVEQAFNSNPAHSSSAKTCNIDATNVTALSLQFDLRQTKYNSTNNNTSWFRVRLFDSNNSIHYLKDIYGDSVFQPQSVNSDMFVSHTFDLLPYVGQNFQISFEAVNKYKHGYGSYDGDNAFVDNVVIWAPSPIDVGVKSIISEHFFGKAGDFFVVKTAFMNMGTDTLHSIPFAYQVDNGVIVRDTVIGTFSPSKTDTLTFAVPHVFTIGDQELCVFAELPNDAIALNDTVCQVLKGMPTFIVDYSDDFESNDDWFSEGVLKQWEKGSPTTTHINSAHSGQNAWVTNLASNYQSSGVEYLYSPYFIIPTYANTAQLEFWMFMDVNVPNAYGQLEYSVDGVNWAAYGFIAAPNSVNWYNQNLGGKHVWSLVNSGWQYTSIQLDSLTFNTGNSFQLRFTFNTGSSAITADGWAIDDFSISLPAMATDAGVNSIIAPMNSTINGDSITVSVEVRNFGLDTLTSFPVSYSIDGSVITTENWTGQMLHGDIDQFTFTKKYKAMGTDYKLCAYTDLTNDMQIQNDTACSTITAMAGALDAGVSTVIAPNGQVTIGKATTVKIVIRNFGTDTLKSVPVEYMLNGNTIANETFTGVIAPNDSADYTFTTTYISAGGPYGICGKTNLVNDVDSTNDMSCVTVIGSSIDVADANQFIVEQNQPNPSNGSTTIEFYLPKAGDVKFELVNMLGAVIETKEMNLVRGKQSIVLNTQNYEVGVYHYSVRFDGQVRSYKMVIVR